MCIIVVRYHFVFSLRFNATVCACSLSIFFQQGRPWVRGAGSDKTDHKMNNRKLCTISYLAAKHAVSYLNVYVYFCGPIGCVNSQVAQHQAIQTSSRLTLGNLAVRQGMPMGFGRCVYQRTGQVGSNVVVVARPEVTYLLFCFLFGATILFLQDACQFLGATIDLSDIVVSQFSPCLFYRAFDLFPLTGCNIFIHTVLLFQLM
jgi:hypothetical protein